MDGTRDDADARDGPSSRGPLAATASILGRKWHPLIVAELLENGPLGFNELKARVNGISDKVLSESLENLQDHGVVERTVIDDKPVRVEYSLTPLGAQLELTLAGMEQWGERYLAQRDEIDGLEGLAEDGEDHSSAT